MKLFTRVVAIFCLLIVLTVTVMYLVSAEKLTFRAGLSSILIMAAIVFYWTYQSLVKPLNELRRSTKKIRDGNLDFEINSDLTSEVGDLVRDFEDMRERLQSSQEEKLKAETESKELIRNIAHDLRTPITTIRGYSEGILDGIADTEEKKERYLRTINKKAQEMSNLIDELSFYAKVDTNRIPYHFARISAEKFFDDCAAEIGDDLSGKNMEFSYVCELDGDELIIADPEQLKRVISNIVGNSVKYMDKPCGLVSLSVFDRGDVIECEIADNGRGVEKQNLTKIYDRFYRADSGRSSPGGSGIGLSVAKKIIEDHGGSIWATGDLGQGLAQHFIIRKYEDKDGQTYTDH